MNFECTHLKKGTSESEIKFKLTSWEVNLVEHPYTRFENTELWRKVSQIIDGLVENQDIQETTKREYIVGYICENMAELLEQK